MEADTPPNSLKINKRTTHKYRFQIGLFILNNQRISKFWVRFWKYFGEYNLRSESFIQIFVGSGPQVEVSGGLAGILRNSQALHKSPQTIAQILALAMGRRRLGMCRWNRILEKN